MCACVLGVDRPFVQLDPSIRKDPWTDDEDKAISVAQAELGNSKFFANRIFGAAMFCLQPACIMSCM